MTADSEKQKTETDIAAIFIEAGRKLDQSTTNAGKLDAILARVPELPSLLAAITAKYPAIIFGQPELVLRTSGDKKIPRAKIQTSVPYPFDEATHSIFVDIADLTTSNPFTIVRLGDRLDCTRVEAGGAWKSELVEDIANAAIGAGIILNPYTPDQSSDRPLYTSCGCRQPKPEPGGTR